jgi:hypothetical protein
MKELVATINNSSRVTIPFDICQILRVSSRNTVEFFTRNNGSWPAFACSLPKLLSARLTYRFREVGDGEHVAHGEHRIVNMLTPDRNMEAQRRSWTTVRDQ